MIPFGFFETAAGGGAAISAWDAIVDAAGGEDYTTLQAAEDALTAPFYVLVKNGSYTGATLAKNAVWQFEPACTITSEIQVDTAKVAIIGNPGFDLQELLDWNAPDGYLDMRNGCSLDGLDAAGLRMYATGGGWGTISDSDPIDVDGVNVGDDDCLIQNLACIGTTGNAAGAIGARADSGALRSVFSGLKVIDSDSHGFFSQAADMLILGCMNLDQDFDGIQANGVRQRFLANYMDNVRHGIFISNSADDSLLVGNILQDPTGTSFTIEAAGENSVAAGNRLDGAPTDSSGTSTVDANDETAF